MVIGLYIGGVAQHAGREWELSRSQALVSRWVLLSVVGQGRERRSFGSTECDTRGDWHTKEFGRRFVVGATAVVIIIPQVVIVAAFFVGVFEAVASVQGHAFREVVSECRP